MKPLVELRPEGLYCPAGDFHIDPWLPVPRAVITHGHGDHARPGAGHYHSTAEGLPILRWRLGEQHYQSHEYGEGFALGDAWVSLHPAGHILGSAQVRIESQGRCWVVSGDYKRDPDPTCAPFEVLPCDGFLTEATFGLPVYRWDPIEETIADLISWWDECRTQERTAVLFCYALGKAQRLLAELARALPGAGWEDRPVFLHGAMAMAVDIYREAGVRMLHTELVAEQGRRGDWSNALVLAPPSAAGTPWLRRFGRASTAFASGWMRVRGNRRRRSLDRGFVVSDHADWPSLLRTIRETGAKQVLATHGNTDALVRFLHEDGVDAQALRSEFGGEET
jgi:putative mRNA 3-end processing factor